MSGFEKWSDCRRDIYDLARTYEDRWRKPSRVHFSPEGNAGKLSMAETRGYRRSKRSRAGKYMWLTFAMEDARAVKSKEWRREQKGMRKEMEQ